MITQFALRLIYGMSWMWVVMPRRQVTCGFFHIQMLVVLGLSVLAMLTAGPQPAETQTSAIVLPGWMLLVPTVALSIAAFCGSIAWKLERRGAGNAFIFAVAGLALALSMWSCMQSAAATGDSASFCTIAHWWISDSSSAMLLGGAVTGMLLGHWYLTSPSMSIALLNRVNTYFGAAAIVRLVVSSVSFVTVWDRITGPTHNTWLALRWLAGIFGPLLVCLMVWRILKYRNTQSATGVLFVGVILVFIGDMAAALLARELGMPL